MPPKTRRPAVPDRTAPPRPATLDQVYEQAAQARRALKAAIGGRKAPAARPGGLRDKVLAHLDAHPGQEFTPHEIHKVLNHSSGAIANATAPWSSSAKPRWPPRSRRKWPVVLLRGGPHGGMDQVARRWTSQMVVAMRSADSASCQPPWIHWNGQNRLAGW